VVDHEKSNTFLYLFYFSEINFYQKNNNISQTFIVNQQINQKYKRFLCNASKIMHNLQCEFSGK